MNKKVRLFAFAAMASASLGVAHAVPTYGTESVTSIQSIVVSINSYFGTSFSIPGGWTIPVLPVRPPTRVPEPATLLLFGLGLVGVGIGAKRKRGAQL